MSEPTNDRSFERWALAGACALALAGIAAFLARKGPAVETTGPERDASADLLRVRIGGERPPPDDTRRQPDDTRREPDDGNLVPDPPPGPPPPPPGPDDDAVPEPPPPPEHRTVVVQPGETLGQIAQRELGSVRRIAEIVELNGIEDPDDIRAGAVLKLPPR